HVSAREADPLTEPVLGCDTCALGDDRRGAVEGEDLLGAAARRGQRERADVAVKVEHALSLGELLDERAVVPLIEVEAGLFAEARRNGVLKAPLPEAQSLDRGS